MTAKLDEALLERCAADDAGPVALHLRQDLLPVEGRGAPFFPATFAMDAKYNIDELADGTRVALVDSVGSQANRMEPLFASPPYSELVPQVTITYTTDDKETGTVSLLEAGHRLGDAIVRCTELASEAQQAFKAQARGDAEPIARLAPTSLVFGAWDSRDTGVKVPRLVQGTVRAWNVARLSRSAQFVPALDYAGLGIMKGEEELKKAEKDQLAERGFLHVPSTGDHGGIVAEGPIRRDVTINLVALRRLNSADAARLRRYLLGLAVVAATAAQDGFLRQGCLLVPDHDSPARWSVVERDGSRTEVGVDHALALAWALKQAKAFKIAPARTVAFDKKLAKEDMARGKKGKKGEQA